MKIKVTAVGLLLLAAVALVAATPGAAAESRSNAIVWKFATQAPKGMGYANAFRDIFLPAMDEATEKTVFWKPYWGGIMGNDDDYVRKMAVGQLQGGGLTLVGTNMISPEFSVLALPFLFNDYDEVDYVRSKLFDRFDAYFMKKDFKLLMWIDQDFDLIYSTKWRFDTLEDFRKAKLLTWSGPIEEAWMKALGASPIVLGIVESPAAIRAGLADSNITTGIWQVGTQVFTTSRYVNMTHWRYTPAALVVSGKAWNQLAKKYQDRIADIRPRTTDRFNAASRKEARNYLDSMIKYGVTPVTPPVEVRQEFRRRCMSVWPQFTGKLFPKSLLDEIVKELDWFRHGGKERLKREREAAETRARRAAAEPVVPPPPPQAAPPAKKEEPKAAEARPEKKAETRAPEAAAPKPEKKAEAAPVALTPEIVKNVQARLKAMRLYKKRVDGLMGPGTRGAIRAYQAKRKLPVTGEIDEALLKALGIK